MNIMENENNRRSSWENKALSIMMLGIENFKILHSVYGTHVSDLIQKQIALLLRQILLSADTVGSCGNGEFLLVLPHTDYCGACELAKNFHSLIKMRVFTESN
ncbi:MAG: diguanylate cyclase [Negativicutes bacterium]